jgi:hypothetical protein
VGGGSLLDTSDPAALAATSVAIFGTIVITRWLWYHWVMTDHRIRLSDDDIALIVAALRARAAMAGPLRRHRIERLADRLGEGKRGNPKWIIDEMGQTHEDELEDDE